MGVQLIAATNGGSFCRCLLVHTTISRTNGASFFHRASRPLHRLWMRQGLGGDNAIITQKTAIGSRHEVTDGDGDARQRPQAGMKGFVVLPKRWIVERTLAWLCRNRRLSKDYERLPSSSATVVYLASLHLMIRRLAKST